MTNFKERAKEFVSKGFNKLPGNANLFLRYMTGLGSEGLNLDDIKKVKKDLMSFLKTGDFKMQSAFDKYKYFEPARLVPYRYDSIMLVIDATIEGLETTK